MRLRAALLAGALATLAATGLGAQTRRIQVRARVGRFGTLAVTVCPGDPPPAEWRRRIREEFNDPTMTLYEPSADTGAIHAELRVVLRAARCDAGAEAYELFMTDGRGEAAQTVMVRVAGVPRDERPQVAAVRLAELYRTHRTELVGVDPPSRMVSVPMSEEELEEVSGAWDAEVGLAVRYLPSSSLGLAGVQLAMGRRSSPASRSRLRFEVGMSLPGSAVPRSAAVLYRQWLAAAWTWDVAREPRVRVAFGARGELAANRGYPTITLGGTCEVQFAVSPRRWLWLRADVGGHLLGAQLEIVSRRLDGGVAWTGGIQNVAEGFTAALTAGVLFGR